VFRTSKWNTFWDNVGPMGFSELSKLIGEFIEDAIDASETMGFDYESYTIDDLKTDIDLLLSNAPVFRRDLAIERLHGFAFMYCIASVEFGFGG
jgi:hypothetical protein